MKRARDFLILLLGMFVLPVCIVATDSEGQAEVKPLGTVCVDSILKNASWKGNDTGVTEKSIFTVQINDLSPIQISTESAGVFSNLTTNTKHLVKIRVDGKPLTSFRFTFQESRSDHLRLWYQPMYGTWSLSPATKRHKCAYLKLDK